MKAFDSELVDQVLVGWPLPVADAVEALAAAIEPHETRDRVVEVFRALLRVIAGYALAARLQFGPGPEPSSAERVAALVTLLRRRGLTDGQWVELTRELLRSYEHAPDSHVLPELVRLFHRNKRFVKLLDRFLSMRKNETVAHGATGDREELAALLEERLPQLRALMELVEPVLTRFVLVVGRGDGSGLRLMGATPNRGRWRRHPAQTPADRVALVDAQGTGKLALHPVALFLPAIPGAPSEVFWLDGASRRGVRYLGIPSMANREEDLALASLDALLVEQAPASSAGERAPFVGLASFGPEDGDRFFGREREADALANRVRRYGLVTVTGVSGSGKTSLVHAGMLPRLEGYRHASVRPGLTPLQALSRGIARALGEEVPLDQVGAWCRTREVALVVVVDQAEEIFTQGHTVDQRERWFRAIADLGGDDAGATRVVLCIREDFFARMSRGPLAGRIEQHLVVVTRPDREAMLGTLTRPVQALGFAFDEGLPERMVDAVGEEPAALALLQFCAARLWEQRDRSWKKLTTEAYERLGGVEGALAGHAEATITALRPAQVPHARTILLQLVTPERTRAVVARSDLATAEEPSTVLDQLVQARLLVVREGLDGEPLVEVVHEALLSHWPRLEAWLSQDEEGHRHRATLRRAASEWASRGRPPGLLWSGDVLTEVELWRRRVDASLGEPESGFLAESVAVAGQGARRRRWAWGGFVSVLVLGLAVTGGLAATTARSWRQASEEADRAHSATERAQASARRAKAALLASRVISWEERDPAMAALMLGELDLSVDSSAASAVDRVSQQLLPTSIVQLDTSTSGSQLLMDGAVTMRTHNDGSGELLAVPDPKRLVLSLTELSPLAFRSDLELGVVMLLSGEQGLSTRSAFQLAWWRASGVQPMGDPVELEVFTSSAGTAVHVAPGFSRLLLTRAQEYEMWEAGAAQPSWSLDERDVQPVFRADGEVLIDCRAGEPIRAWRARTGEPLPSRQAWEHELQLCLPIPESDAFVLLGRSGHVARLDADGSAPVELGIHPGRGVAGAVLSDDGQVLAATSPEGTLLVLHTDGTGEPEVHDFGERIVAVPSKDGSWLAVSAPGKLWWIERSEGWKQWSVPVGQQAPAYLHASDEVLTLLFEHELRTYERFPGKKGPGGEEGVRVLRSGDPLHAAVWSPDGRQVALAGRDVEVFAVGGERLHTLAPMDGTPNFGGLQSTGASSDGFSADGRFLLTADFAGGKVWNLDDGSRRSLGRHETHGALVRLLPHPTEPSFVTSWEDGRVLLHTYENDAPRELRAGGSTKPVLHQLSRDGARLGLLFTDYSVWVHDLRDDTSHLHELGFGQGTLSEDGEWVVHIGPEGLQIVPALGGEVRSLDGSGAHRFAYFSPDGSKLLTYAVGGELQIFDVATGAAEASTKVQGVPFLLWSPDGQDVVFFPRNTPGDPMVWNPESGLQYPLVGHQGIIRSASFAPDGRLLTTGDDGTARIWTLDLFERQQALRSRIEGCLPAAFRQKELAESREQALAAFASCQERLGRTPSTPESP